MRNTHNLGAMLAASACLAILPGMTAAERAAGRFMRGPDGHDPAGDGRREIDASTIVTELKASLATATDKVKGIAEDALGRAKAGEDLSKSAKEIADEAMTSFNALKGTVTELEQKLARERVELQSGHTAGQRLIDDEAFKSFAGQARPRGRIVVDVKDISSLTTDAAGSVGAMIQTQYASAPPLPQRRMTIRALLASGQTNGNLIEFDREKVFTNSADVVADGASKPQSEIQFEDAQASVRTIAHWMRVNVQTLADAPALRSIIDQRLRYGLAYKEELQLLTGSGTGQNISGLVTNATAYAAPGSLVAADPIDVIRLMILQVVLAEYPANGIVMNPIDMAAIEMLRDDTGRHLIGNPQGTIQKQLWGLPVIETQAITVDKALVGAFDMAAQIFDRQDATVELSTEDGDNFTKNKVTIRAEERLALAIYRPQSLVYGDLGRVA